MDYRQRKELFEMATSKDFIPKDRFKLGYEIGLRSVAPLMFLYVIYFFVAGPIDTWIISSINVVAILAVATYWAGKKYGLHLNPSFFWACFWRLVVYSILLNIVAVFIVMLLQLAGFRGGKF